MSAKIATGNSGNTVIVHSIVEGNEGPLSQLDNGELVTFDANLENVFGSQPLIGPTQRLQVDPLPTDITSTGVMNSVRPIFAAKCSGYATAAIAVNGTWTGTITFEVSIVGANDWIAVAGYPAASNVIPVSTTTANGIWKFNVAGLSSIRARFSTPTTGSPNITISLSQNQTNPGPTIAYGSQSTALNQRATTFELNTYDTNLAAMTATSYGIDKTTTAVPNSSRLKVEIVGHDTSNPFNRNFDGTYDINVYSYSLKSMLELIQRQIMNTNLLLLRMCDKFGCNMEDFVFVGEIDEE